MFLIGIDQYLKRYIVDKRRIVADLKRQVGSNKVKKLYLEGRERHIGYMVGDRAVVLFNIDLYP